MKYIAECIKEFNVVNECEKVFVRRGGFRR